MQKLLTDATTTATGNPLPGPVGAFQATGKTSSGTGAAGITIQVSNDNIVWMDLGTMSLTLGTTETADGFVAAAGWAMVRAKITSISGTGAAVSVTMSN